MAWFLQNGSFYVRNDIIYVQATVDGRRMKKSTGKKATPINLKWIKSHYREVLQHFIDNESNPTQVNISLKKFGYQVLALGESKRIPSVQRDYIAAFENHILPYFKKFAINQIKSHDIEIWQKHLLSKMSSRTANRCRMILNLILKKAYANDLVSKNYGDLAEKVTVEYSKQEPYSVEEMQLMLKSSTGILQVYLYVAFLTGMRIGEILALKYSDFDFNNSLINLQRSLSKGRVVEAMEVASSGKVIKNHCRTIIIPNFLTKMILDWKNISPNKEWLFVADRTNRPFYESRTMAKYLKQLLEKLNIKYKTLKATRHTFISILRSEGIEKSFIQDLVGHTQDSFVTDKHYTTLHITQTRVNAVNNVFKNMQICPKSVSVGNNEL